MQKKTFRFPQAPVDYYFESSISLLPKLTDRRKTILVTDENVFDAHKKKFANWETIVLQPGEAYKNQSTVDQMIKQLIDAGADRTTTLVGMGGGVITDLAGYTASVYMRGIRFGFIPTSILAMVDAAIGGKNGIDVGAYKNMVGSIRQPSFILYDPRLTDTLPETEWRNGFAEIIKHAAIRDGAMFRELEQQDLSFYRKQKKALATLIQRNAILKTNIVRKDEQEKGDRKLLNFGHTLGHAVENQYALPHGHAISIGMKFAGLLSQEYTGFREEERLQALLERYGLPVELSFDRKAVFKMLKMDKKRSGKDIHFVLLEKIGKALIRKISIEQLYRHLR